VPVILVVSSLQVPANSQVALHSVEAQLQLLLHLATAGPQTPKSPAPAQRLFMLNIVPKLAQVWLAPLVVPSVSRLCPSAASHACAHRPPARFRADLASMARAGLCDAFTLVPCCFNRVRAALPAGAVPRAGPAAGGAGVWIRQRRCHTSPPPSQGVARPLAAFDDIVLLAMRDSCICFCARYGQPLTSLGLLVYAGPGCSAGRVVRVCPEGQVYAPLAPELVSPDDMGRVRCGARSMGLPAECIALCACRGLSSRSCHAFFHDCQVITPVLRLMATLVASLPKSAKLREQAVDFVGQHVRTLTRILEEAASPGTR
jgi:hypothetical protein